MLDPAVLSPPGQVLCATSHWFLELLGTRKHSSSLLEPLGERAAWGWQLEQRVCERGKLLPWAVGTSPGQGEGPDSMSLPR